MFSDMDTHVSDFGQLLSQAQQVLEDRILKLPLNSHVICNDIRFQLHLDSYSHSECLLTVSSCLGRLPFTAESASQRQACLKQYHQIRKSKQTCLHIKDNALIHYQEQTLIPIPAGRNDLIASLAIILLALRPVQKLAQSLASATQ